MRKILLSAVVIPLVVLGGVGAALAFGEGRAHASLDDEVRSFVEQRFPGETVLSTNVRGRPYLLSQWNQEMQLAYVELAPPPGAVRHLLLVRNLADGRSGVVSSFLWLPYAEHPTEPVLASDGSFTDTAVVAGRPVRFGARVEAGRVTVTADGGSPPAPVELEMLDGFSLDAVRAMDEGVAVGLDMSP